MRSCFGSDVGSECVHVRGGVKEEIEGCCDSGRSAHSLLLRCDGQSAAVCAEGGGAGGGRERERFGGVGEERLEIQCRKPKDRAGERNCASLRATPKL